MSEKQLPLRQRQAHATRALVVDAARKLFLDDGYANTTIESIANQAGVAASTVYAIFGSKRGILREIRLAWHEETHIREFLTSNHADVEPAVLLERLAFAVCRQWETGKEVVAIYKSAAAADRDARAELETALAGRRKGLDAFTCKLEPQFRPGLDIHHASAILRTLCQVEVYEELVIRSEWSPTEYIEWLIAALKKELLAS